MSIVDRSGVPSVGLALLRANLARLKPVSRVRWEQRGERRFLIVEGPAGETFESCSFLLDSEAEKIALALLA
ncbi:MAG: hypothetical protein Q8N51_01225 [Gammaproteobacteria bacterium]|nr:hypothetical protein [Gammaproteobacteria bacterium]